MVFFQFIYTINGSLVKKTHNNLHFITRHFFSCKPQVNVMNCNMKFFTIIGIWIQEKATSKDGNVRIK